MHVIKRYANRKLYDTEARRYITLEGVADLVRREKDVHVIDHETGEDITAMTQAQIIFEQERRLKGGLPRSVFTNLIQAGSDTLSQLRRALTASALWNAQVNTEIEKRIDALIREGDLPEAEGRRLLDKLIAAGEVPPEAESHAETESIERRHGIPSRTDVARLREQIEALSATLDDLAQQH
jgi:polyhydroxyalkanoate synthesis repressor PhaR